MDAYERAASEAAVRALIQAGNIQGAEARLRNMLAQSSDDARAMALLAHCQFIAGGKKEAVATARAAAQIEPDDPLVRSMLAHALQVGAKSKKDLQAAEDLAEDIAAEDPEDSHSIFQLAIARHNNKDPWGARKLFDDAERFASTAQELINVAWLRMREWNYAAAAPLALRAMELDPTRPEIFQILAECAIARKEPLEAYELALEALRLSPGDKEIMRLLTRARVRSNTLLRPFLPMIDWIVEMDRRGLVVVPLLMAVLGFIFAVSLVYDLRMMELGQSPAIILSAAAGVALLFATVSYWTAIAARLRIRRDLRKISLPNF